MIIFLCVVLLFVLFLNSKLKLDVVFSYANIEHTVHRYDYRISIIYFKKIKSFSRKDINIWIKNRRKKKGISNNNRRRSIKYLKFLNNYIKFFEFEKITTYVRSGLISVIPTSFSVPIISTLLAFVYSKYNICLNNNCNFLVEPSYNKLELTVDVNSIISIKIVNIIYILLKIWIERRNKNGRTSNRRSYEYCYE